jgi:hypothetical protein
VRLSRHCDIFLRDAPFPFRPCVCRALCTLVRLRRGGAGADARLSGPFRACSSRGSNGRRVGRDGHGARRNGACRDGACGSGAPARRTRARGASPVLLPWNELRVGDRRACARAASTRMVADRNRARECVAPCRSARRGECGSRSPLRERTSRSASLAAHGTGASPRADAGRITSEVDPGDPAFFRAVGRLRIQTHERGKYACISTIIGASLAP